MPGPMWWGVLARRGASTRVGSERSDLRGAPDRRSLRTERMRSEREAGGIGV